MATIFRNWMTQYPSVNFHSRNGCLVHGVTRNANDAMTYRKPMRVKGTIEHTWPDPGGGFLNTKRKGRPLVFFRAVLLQIVTRSTSWNLNLISVCQSFSSKNIIIYFTIFFFYEGTFHDGNSGFRKVSSNIAPKIIVQLGCPRESEVPHKIILSNWHVPEA